MEERREGKLCRCSERLLAVRAGLQHRNVLIMQPPCPHQPRRLLSALGDRMEKKNNQVTAGGASGPRIFICISGRKSQRNFALRFLNSARHEVNLATSGLREKQSLLFRLNCPEPPRSSGLNDVSVSHTLWLVLFAPLIFWDRINSTGICTGAACFA